MATVQGITYRYAPNLRTSVSGTSFAYRDLGPRGGTPLVLLNHLAATLDNFDPAIVDRLAAHRRVVAFDNRGIGASAGRTPTTVRDMARDAIGFIRAMGFETVDLLGFSLGGFVAQEFVLTEPTLVRRLILAGTGPAGGIGIDKVTGVTIAAMLRAAFTRKDPKFYLFFTRTPAGRSAANAFLSRLKARDQGRDDPIRTAAFRAQLKAIRTWGRQAPQDLSQIRLPTFVANGDQDAMVPTSNSVDLARRIPDSRLTIYEDAGHGGIFQNHAAFVEQALAFLDE